MKTTMVIVAVALLLLLGGAAWVHKASDHGTIVRVKSPDDRTGYLGVSIQDMTHRLAKGMGTKTDEGALVTDVTEDSPAEEAGIKEEDIITEVDGKKISDADDLREVVRHIKPETRVDIIVMRKDEKKTLTATIGKAPRTRSYSYSFTPPEMPRIPRGPMSIHIFRNSRLLGMELSELNEQLGKYFEAPDGKGVLVNEVEEGSKAEKAGFLAGDVITKIGKEPIEDIRDVEHALRDYKKGDKADVEIIRKGSRKTLTVDIPDGDRHHGFGVNPWGDGQDEMDLEMDLRDLPRELPHHDLDKLKMELRRLGREIEAKVRQIREGIEGKLDGVMS